MYRESGASPAHGEAPVLHLDVQDSEMAPGMQKNGFGLSTGVFLWSWPRGTCRTTLGVLARGCKNGPGAPRGSESGPRQEPVA